MIDSIVPDFHKRRKAGEVFFNDMTKSKVTVASSGSAFNLISKANTCNSPVLKGEQRIDGVLTNLWVPHYAYRGLVYLPSELLALSEGDIRRLEVQCSTEVLSKRGRSDSDLWESMAEYKQTLDLLKNPLDKIRSLSSQLLQSSSTVAGRRLLKEVSGGYLLYRYGVIPLMKDIESIINSLKKVTGKQRKTSRSFGSLTARQTTSGTSSWNGASFSYTAKVTDTVNLRCMSLDEVDLSFIGNLGFSFKGLVTLPWELTGYSFVADWFLNIGDFLGSKAPSLGYNQLGSCMVTNRVTATSYEVTGTGYSDPFWDLASPLTGTTSVVRETTTRRALAPASVVLKNDFRFENFTRTADAFALLASRFTKVSNLIGPQPNLSAFRQRSSYAKWLNQPGVT
jgi:hypothetical protein